MNFKSICSAGVHVPLFHLICSYIMDLFFFDLTEKFNFDEEYWSPTQIF